MYIYPPLFVNGHCLLQLLNKNNLKKKSTFTVNSAEVKKVVLSYLETLLTNAQTVNI